MADESKLTGLNAISLPLQATDLFYVVRGNSSNQANVGDITASTIGLGNVPNVDATNASNLAAGTVPYARVAGIVSNVANSVAAGNDARFSDARAPTGNAGGFLAGTYPNPTAASNAAGQIGLGNVTNAAQTLASVVPNTLPNSGQILIGNSANTAYLKQTMSGDGTLAADGTLTVTKTNGVNFAASATTDATNASNLSSGTVPYARVGGIVGTIANTVAQGNDSRFTDARTPTGNAGGFLSGNYPNPGAAADAAAQIGLGNVTNAAQTLASVVPNTLPNAGQILVGVAGNTAYAKVTMSGDGTLASTGALTVTKTNGVAFAASATTDATNASNLSSGTVPMARVNTNLKMRTLGWGISNGNSVVPTGQLRVFSVNFNCNIVGWCIAGVGTTPTCTLDIWKTANGTALPTVSNTIMGTKPALATGNFLRSTTLTNWTIGINAGSILIANLDTVTNATELDLQVDVVPTD